MFIAGLEKNLGLDKLGITLDDLISAIDSPVGESAKKLDEALKELAGGEHKGAPGDLRPDAAGLYGP